MTSITMTSIVMSILIFLKFLAADGAGVRTVLEPITAGKVVRDLINRLLDLVILYKHLKIEVKVTLLVLSIS